MVWEPQLFFLILGEEAYDSREDAPSDKRGPLRLLDEHEHDQLSVNEFFSRLTDSMLLHSCEDVYGNITEKDYTDAFYEFQHEKQVRGISLIDAPYHDNFRLGVSIRQDWINDGRLKIPKDTLTWEHLEAISSVDIEDSPETKFFRLRALAYCVAGFAKYPPSKPLQYRPPRHYHGPHDWMAG